MVNDIHRKVLKRLFVSWVALSAAIGGTVYYLETEKVDDRVLELAVGESQTLTADTLRLFDRPPEERAPLRAKVDELLKSHFIIVELYDRQQKKIIEGMDPGEAEVEDQLKKRAHSFPFGEEKYYRRISLGDELFLQVLLPLKGSGGALAGYFEGVYRVDADTLAHIHHDVLRTLVLVVVAILVTTVILYPIILWLNKELLRFSGELLKTNLELMEVLGSAVAKRDSDTNIHNYRVTLYAIRLAESLGLPNLQIRNLTAGAFLHDVGKIGISDAILLKPGRLTAEEFDVMRTHVALGVDIIAKSELLRGARDVVEFHHEKFDGKGYLKGLKGEEIPLNARIFAIVDVFDALTSKRPYKEPMPFDEAVAILRRDAGSHFDPALVDVFDAIAPTLYQQVSNASEPEIEAMLNNLARKYFFDDTFLVEYLARLKSQALTAR